MTDAKLTRSIGQDCFW